MTSLNDIAPAFVSMAHRIVWCTVATVDSSGNARTRVLHPIWEWQDGALTGWILTSPTSPKASDLAAHPQISLTYWATDHDTCSAECATEWDDTPELRRAGWDRFANGPAPVGYDPRLIPRWTAPDVAEFGVLRLHPYRLRVMPGTVMLAGKGALLTWRAS